VGIEERDDGSCKGGGLTLRLSMHRTFRKSRLRVLEEKMRSPNPKSRVGFRGRLRKR